MSRHASPARSAVADNAVPAAPRERCANRGRFQPGNAGGPGNPFVKRLGELRKMALEAADPERMRKVMDTLFELAVERDLAAIKLWLQYTIGKPGEAVDPDVADAEDLPPDELPTPDESVASAPVATEEAPSATPASGASARANQRPAPIANVSNGEQAGEVQPPAPIGNGSNGEAAG